MQHIPSHLVITEKDVQNAYAGLSTGEYSGEECNPIVMSIRRRIPTVLKINLDTLEVEFSDRPPVSMRSRLKLLAMAFEFFAKRNLHRLSPEDFSRKFWGLCMCFSRYPFVA